MVRTPKTPRRARGEFMARFRAKLRHLRRSNPWRCFPKICQRRGSVRWIEVDFSKPVGKCSAVSSTPNGIVIRLEHTFENNREGIGIHTDPNEGEGPAGCIQVMTPPSIPVEDWRRRDGAVWTDTQGNPVMVFDGGQGEWMPVGYLKRYRDAAEDLEAGR